MKIYIQGYASFEDWRQAGYPGAKSFPPERRPDPERGLCIEEGCGFTDRNGRGGRCAMHTLRHKWEKQTA